MDLNSTFIDKKTGEILAKIGEYFFSGWKGLTSVYVSSFYFIFSLASVYKYFLSKIVLAFKFLNY